MSGYTNIYCGMLWKCTMSEMSLYLRPSGMKITEKKGTCGM